MTRAGALKVLNPILPLLVINQLGTGLLADGLPHEAFEILHEGGGIALGVTALIHLTLNWNWVQATYLRSRTARS